MKVENPGGSAKLEVTYMIFSKLPIERGDVETDANANYQVAQVCLESKLNFTEMNHYVGFYLE